MKKIVILGSTGSIGTQALDVIDKCGNFKVAALAANKNITLLEEQIRKYKPDFAAVADEDAARVLKTRVADTPTRVSGGNGAVCEAASIQGSTVLTAMVGIAGLNPTISAIEAGNNIALSNKETLVTAGKYVMELARKKGVSIIPVDSEHSAVFQCLRSQGRKIKRIILTASGGPFFGRDKEELKEVTPGEALRHPNWSMGKKVTIDSATLMNKGLEVIEAMHLFGVDASRIDVLVHRQSIIHSMVEFCDNSVIAQMSVPDMRLPISYALNFPESNTEVTEPLDFLKLCALTFEKPDTETFKCLRLAFAAAKEGGSLPAVMNAANEIAVGAFLSGKITFDAIADIIEETMEEHKTIVNPSICDIIESDAWAREFAKGLVECR